MRPATLLCLALQRDEQTLLVRIAEHGSYLKAVEAGRGR